MGPRIFGALIGAVIAPLLLVLLVSTFYHPPSHDNWDWATPAMTLAASIGALVVGGVAGAMIADALRAGNSSLALKAAGATVALIAAFPIWLLWIVHGPRPAVKPRTADQRAEWAAERNTFYATHGFSEQPGISLAWQLRTEFRGGTLSSSVEWRRHRNGEDSIARNGIGYTNQDDGWRFGSLDDPRRLTVFLDPRLQRDGPVFEVGMYDIIRRASADAPGYSTDSTLAALLRIPDCITQFARDAKANGNWDGQPDSLGDAIAKHWSAAHGCPSMSLSTRAEDRWHPWEFTVSSPSFNGSRFELRPDPTNADAPFRFSFMYAGRGFMREAGGQWHVRAGSAAYQSDPPVPRCLFDLTVPCDASIFAAS